MTPLFSLGDIKTSEDAYSLELLRKENTGSTGCVVTLNLSYFLAGIAGSADPSWAKGVHVSNPVLLSLPFSRQVVFYSERPILAFPLIFFRGSSR